MTGNIFKKITVSLSLPVLILLTLALTATPAVGAGFSITPSDPNLRLFNLEIAPGAEKQASVLIENVSDEPITLSVYGADGTQSNQGTFALTTRASEQKHIGIWVSFTGESVTIEPHRNKEVGFTVKVPVTATPGIYSGGIAAEQGGNGSNGAVTGGGNAISISARIVVKMFVTVPGEKINRYEWTDFYFKPSNNGNPGTFNLSYKNTGNTIITADQEVTVKGFPGKEQTFKLTPAMLLQGSIVDIPFKWENEPYFGYYSATATTTFSEYDITSNTKVNSKVETRIIPVYVPLKTHTIEGQIAVGIMVAAGMLLVIIALIIVLNISFRKKCLPYVVGEGDTIATIAEKCKVNWKKLVKVNKLKAPYTIKPGQKILAPLKKNEK
jgi:hypothetical protein